MFLKNKYIKKIKLSLILIKQRCLLKCISTSRANWSCGFRQSLQWAQKTTGSGAGCPCAVRRKLAAALRPSAGVFPQKPVSVPTESFDLFSSEPFFDCYERLTSDAFHPQTVPVLLSVSCDREQKEFSWQFTFIQRSQSSKIYIFWIGTYWLKWSRFLEIFAVVVIISF